MCLSVLCGVTGRNHVTKIRRPTQRTLRGEASPPVNICTMNRFILLAVFCSPATLGLELGVGLMKELLSFPLKNNPFFAAVVALSGNFNTDGIIDDTVDSSGYACQMLGDFKCQEDFPKCSGMKRERGRE